MEFLSQVYLGNTLQDWLLSAAAFLVTFTVLPLVRKLVVSQRNRIQSLEPPMGVELALVLIARTSKLFLWIVALYVAERFLELGPRVEKISNIVIVVVFWFQVALWGTAAINFALDLQRRRAAENGDAGVQGSLGIVNFIARLAVFAIAALLALDNLGVNITALVAGLGVGGIAIALAVQTILGDLLASLSITLDKPFVVGDWLRLDTVEGTVEKIGVKSTRLRSLSGEQIIVSNADLLQSRLHNLGRMPERRALFKLGVVYETPRDKLERIPALVEACVKETPGTRFLFCVFTDFGDFALQFTLVYFVALEQGANYLETVGAVNYRIHAAFEQEGISFAYPTQTVVMRREGQG
ncbi:MAG: mechanosensitive ion channel family protein [Steroidobacteraceae bacterium]